jgi:hypothetical protein
VGAIASLKIREEEGAVGSSITIANHSNYQGSHTRFLITSGIVVEFRWAFGNIHQNTMEFADLVVIGAGL